MCIYLGHVLVFFVVQHSFASRPNEQRYIFVFMSTLWTFRAQNIINFKREWCTLLFLLIYCSTREYLSVWKKYWQEQSRSESWSETFACSCIWNFYIAIWSCMKLEDVLKVLPMLIPNTFVDQFVFIWRHEQCSKTSGQISFGSYYYLKDLKCVYYSCHGLLYEKEDQTLPIDDKPSKTFWNPKWSGLFLESSKGELLLKNKV